MRINLFSVVLVFIGLTLRPVVAESEKYLAIIDPPASHVWDRDGLYRNNRDRLSHVSAILKDLKAEYGMEVYVVIYSSLVGEKPTPFSRRCQKAWLGEKNDGLVFVLTFNGGMSGAIGQSDDLYAGHFIEEGILPRVSKDRLSEIVKNALEEVRKEDGEVDQVQVFLSNMTDDIKKHLVIVKKEDASRESYHFMGWMALALIICGVLMAVLSKLLGAVDRRSRKEYAFPDFVVQQRLRAPNGGGKISVVDYK